MPAADLPVNAARKAAVAQAERWTQQHAERLGISTERVLELVWAGVTPDRIERVQVGAELIGAPRRG